jgi:hypothetical protein
VKLVKAELRLAQDLKYCAVTAQIAIKQKSHLKGWLIVQASGAKDGARTRDLRRDRATL